MGRRLTIRNGCTLTLDHLSGFPRDFYKRSYLLDKFNVQCDYIEPGDSYATFMGRLGRRVKVRLNMSRPLEKKTYVLEDNAKFEPALLDLRLDHPTYFEGYW